MIMLSLANCMVWYRYNTFIKVRMSGGKSPDLMCHSMSNDICAGFYQARSKQLITYETFDTDSLL